MYLGHLTKRVRLRLGCTLLPTRKLRGFFSKRGLTFFSTFLVAGVLPPHAVRTRRRATAPVETRVFMWVASKPFSCSRGMGRAAHARWRFTPVAALQGESVAEPFGPRQGGVACGEPSAFGNGDETAGIGPPGGGHLAAVPSDQRPFVSPGASHRHWVWNVSSLSATPTWMRAAARGQGNSMRMSQPASERSRRRIATPAMANRKTKKRHRKHSAEGV